MLAILLVAGLIPLVAPSTADAATTYRIGVRVNTTLLIKGEAVYVTAVVRTASGRPAKGVIVDLQRRPMGSRTWKTFTSGRSGDEGRVWYTNRPHKKYAYRAVVRKTSTVNRSASGTAWVGVTTGTRSLEARASQLDGFLGSAIAPIRKSGDSTWRQYQKAVLVKGPYRTWVVRGKFYTAYRKAGGVTGRLGRPVADQLCSLLERGCVQRFQGGSMYYSATEPTITIQYGEGRWTQAGAVARSQVGYVEPRFRVNKYNTWAGANNAWCGVFQSWVSTASGLGHQFPFAKDFATLKARVKAAGLRVSKPKPGRVAFFDWGTGTVYHSGLIIAVDGNKLTTIEGNTTVSGGFDNGDRVVAKRTRYTNQVLYYANPYE